jgi:hypothetical protein
MGPLYSVLLGGFSVCAILFYYLLCVNVYFNVVYFLIFKEVNKDIIINYEEHPGFYLTL